MIEFINLIFSLFIIYFSILGYGLIINSSKIKHDIFLTFISGYFFIGLTTLIFHFFFPIGNVFSLVVIIFGIFLLIIKRKYLIKSFYFEYLFVYLIISLLLVGYSDHAIDSNMYHHPYISYLKSEKIIFGIANIEFRFGHISFLQYVQAALTNNYLNLISISAPNLVIFSMFIIYSADEIFKRNENIITFLVTLMISSFVLIKLARFREFGNDLIPFVVSSYFFINVIKSYYKKQELNLFYFSPIFGAFMLVHKISYIFSTLIFLAIFKIKYLANFKNYKLILILFLSLVILWLIKNFIHTSCFIYPIIQTCMANTDWYLTGISDPERASRLTELWAKDFITNPEWKNINLDDYMNSFAWVNNWLNNHFIKILEKLSPLFATFIIINFFFFIKKSNKKVKLESKKFFLNLVILTSIGLIIWFLKAPLFRYGSFYIISFLILIFIILNLNLIKRVNLKELRKLKYIFFISLIFFSVKNISRQINSENNFFTETTKNINNYKIVNKDPIIIRPIKIPLCYYTYNICSHEIPKGFKVSRLKNYYLIN